MKQFSFLFIPGLMAAFCANAQRSLKPDYLTHIPVHFKDCGALYTYDSVSLQKKKYILVTDFQNLGMISIGGKEIKLQLADTRTTGNTNTSIYNGDGYTIELTYQTITQGKKTDTESGNIKISKGDQQVTVNIHGLSGCDVSKQEGNGK